MGKLAFVFPGQGAQYSGMGKDFYEGFESSRLIFDTADEILGIPLSDICFHGEDAQLAMTEITQPAVLTVSVAILDALLERVQAPDVTAGLSLGEYAALVCSQGMDFADTVRLVQKRGKFMQEAVPAGVGTMAAVMGLSEEDIYEVCSEASAEGIVEPSNFNCPGQTVIGGEIAAVEKACSIAKEKGAKRAVRLNVSAPFHTSMLERAAEQLWSEIGKMEIKPMRIPVVSNTDAREIQSHQRVAETLVKQVMSPVLWEESVRNMIADGVDTFVEIGPGKTLSGFIRKIDKGVKVYNIYDRASYEDTVLKLEESGYGKDSRHHWIGKGNREADSRRAI